MTLKVTPDQVRAKAGQIKGYRSAMEGLMGDMKSEIHRLPTEYWDSRSGQNFVQRFQNVEGNILRALQALYQHINNLQEAADRYDALERAQEAKVDNLSTKNIF